MKHPPSPTAPLRFVALTFLCQTVAITTALATRDITHSLPFALMVATIAAPLVARFLNLTRSWIALNALLPVSMATSLAIETPSWIFLVPLVGMLLTYAPTFWTRVPYYPTSTPAYALILAELPTDRPFTFIDIGCGFGDLLFFLERHRPNGRFVGIEIGIVPWAFARVKSLLYRSCRVEIALHDLWKRDLAEFDYVYAFLSPAAMRPLWEKVKVEMRPGTTFITNSFEVGAPPSQIIPIKDGRKSALLIYRLEPGYRGKSAPAGYQGNKVTGDIAETISSGCR